MQNQKLQIQKKIICVLIEPTKKQQGNTGDLTSSMGCGSNGY